MAYKIVFKGGLAEEFVEGAEGAQIAKLYLENRLPERIELNGNIYDSKSIKGVVKGFQNPDKTDRDERTIKMLADMHYEHEQASIKKRRQPPEVRCKNVGIAEILHTTLVGSRMPEELREQVIAAQFAFFQKNPDYAEARPSCYRHLMPHAEEAKPYHIRGAVVDSAFNLVERAVSSGIK